MDPALSGTQVCSPNDDTLSFFAPLPQTAADAADQQQMGTNLTVLREPQWQWECLR